MRSANFPTRGGGGPIEALRRYLLAQAPTGVRIEFTDTGLFQRWLAAGGSVTGGEVLPGESSVRLTVYERDGRGVVDARIDRLPYEDEEVSPFKIHVDVPSDSESPTVEITEWMNGQAVGGNVLQPEVRFPYRIFLPELKAKAPGGAQASR